MAEKDTIQSTIERIMSKPGNVQEWIARAVEAGIPLRQARLRIHQSLWYYRRHKLIVKRPHGQEQLVKAREA